MENRKRIVALTLLWCLRCFGSQELIINDAALLNSVNATVAGNLLAYVAGGVPPYTFTLCTSASGGQVNLLPSGEFTFTSNCNGLADFCYEVTDAHGLTGQGMVDILAACPISKDVTIPVLAVQGTLTGNLNDAVSGGFTPYSFAVVGEPVGGTVTVERNGVYTFVATAAFRGLGGFEYVAVDRNNTHARGKVQMNITAPIAKDGSFQAHYDSLQGNLLNLVSNGIGEYSFACPSDMVCADGHVTIDKYGNFSFTAPSHSHNQPCSFMYQVTDEAHCMSLGKVTIQPNLAPRVPDVQICISCDVPLQGTLSNRACESKNQMSYIQVGESINGKAIVYADGTFSFVPNARFVGEGGFAYQVRDCSANQCVSNVAKVTITVKPSGPVAVPNSFYAKMLKLIP